MYSPASRVLSALELLQVRGTVPAAELAERLEVEPRTVRRYITALRDLGIPVESTPGRGGGYRLGPGAKLPPLMFSDAEALAVIVGLLGTLARDPASVDQSGATAALAKIARVLPADLKAGIAALQATVEFTSIETGGPAILPAQASEATILAVATAGHLHQRLTLEYRSWRGDVTTRQLDPYGLVQHIGSWYVVGWCHLREDIRVFRLDRIMALRLERETFEPPEQFDAREYIVRSLALAPYRWHIEVLIDAPLAQVGPLIPDGVAAATLVPDGVLLESRMDRLEPFARFLAGLGLACKVIRPVELRDELRRIALVLLEGAGEGARARGDEQQAPSRTS